MPTKDATDFTVIVEPNVMDEQLATMEFLKGGPLRQIYAQGNIWEKRAGFMEGDYYSVVLLIDEHQLMIGGPDGSAFQIGEFTGELSDYCFDDFCEFEDDEKIFFRAGTSCFAGLLGQQLTGYHRYSGTLVAYPC